MFYFGGYSINILKILLVVYKKFIFWDMFIIFKNEMKLVNDWLFEWNEKKN